MKLLALLTTAAAAALVAGAAVAQDAPAPVAAEAPAAVDIVRRGTDLPGPLTANSPRHQAMASTTPATMSRPVPLIVSACTSVRTVAKYGSTATRPRKEAPAHVMRSRTRVM